MLPCITERALLPCYGHFLAFKFVLNFLSIPSLVCAATAVHVRNPPIDCNATATSARDTVAIALRHCAMRCLLAVATGLIAAFKYNLNFA